MNVNFFYMEEFKYIPFPSFAFPNLSECWWEGSAPTVTPPTSLSGILGQCNKIGDVTFRADPVFTTASVGKEMT